MLNGETIRLARTLRMRRSSGHYAVACASAPLPAASRKIRQVTRTRALLLARARSSARRWAGLVGSRRTFRNVPGVC